MGCCVGSGGVQLGDGQYLAKQHVITVPANVPETGRIKCVDAYFRGHPTRSLKCGLFPLHVCPRFAALCLQTDFHFSGLSLD